jgi:uncharacterized protein YceK
MSMIVLALMILHSGCVSFRCCLNVDEQLRAKYLNLVVDIIDNQDFFLR